LAAALLRLVGVEDRLHLFGVDGRGLDAGALDLQRLADGAVAGAQPRFIASVNSS
jgi:hypothetical protein